MYYTIYKITNKLNGKIYIGKHQTKDLNDGYMGSGKYLKRAIEKYGIENFSKEILNVFDNEEKMNAEEAKIVTEEFVKDNNNYNLCIGGEGGFSYINSNGLNVDIVEQRSRNQNMVSQWSKNANDIKKLKLKNDLIFKETYLKNMSNGVKKYIHENGHWWNGKTHTEETKRKISEANSNHQMGKDNSQYGTMWITDGINNKKIKKDVDFIPDGWYKGRKI
jgi:3-oxoacyl-ACP reductase-like protein